MRRPKEERAARGRLAAAVRAIARVVLATLVTTVVVAGLTLLVVARTELAREATLAWLRGFLDEHIVGGVHIGALEGDLLGDAVLRDVVLNDEAGEPALSADRVVLRLAPLALLHREVRFTRAEGFHMQVHAHRLGDGRWNVFSLIAPAKKPPRHRWRVELPSARGHGVLAIEELAPLVPRAKERATSAAAGAGGEAAKFPILVETTCDFRVTGFTSALHVDVVDARGVLAQPSPGTVQASGRIALGGLSDVPVFEDGHLTLTTTGAALARVVPALARLAALDEPIAATLSVKGSLQDLAVGATVTPARGQLTVNAKLGYRVTLAPGRSRQYVFAAWSADVAARGLDLSLLRGLPHLVLDGDVRAEGQGRDLHARIGGLRLRGDGLDASAEGDVRSDGRASLSIEADARLERAAALMAGTRRRLASPSRHGSARASHRPRREISLRGGVHLSLRAANGPDGLRLDATLRGRGLSSGTVRAALASATVSLAGRRATIAAFARDAKVASRSVAHARLDGEVALRADPVLALARGERDAMALVDGLSASLSAAGAGLSASMRLSARRRVGPAGESLVGDLSRLSLSIAPPRAGGRAITWSLPRAAHVEVGPRRIAVERLALSHGAERIALDARVDGAKVSGRLAIERVDVTALAHLLRPAGGQRLPRVVLSAALRASGTRSSPRVVGPIQAVIEPAVREAERAAAAGSPTTTTTAATKAAAHATTTKAAAHATTAQRAREPERWTLRGAVAWAASRLHAGATLSLPEGGTLTVDATVPLSGRGLSPGGPRREAHPSLDTPIAATLAGRALRLQHLLHLLRRAGALDVSALEAALDTAPHAGAHAGEALTRLDGKLDFDVRAAGTVRSPRVTLSLALRDGRVAHVKPLGLSLSGTLAARRLAFEGSLSLSGAPLLSARGEATLDLSAALAGRAPLDGPIAITASVDRFDLARLRPLAPAWQRLQGRLVGRIDVKGTLRDPRASLSLAADGAGDGRLVFERASVSGLYQRGRFEGSLAAHQGRGGDLSATASYVASSAASPEGPLAAHVEARAFDLSFLPAIVPALRSVEGTLDGQLRVTGTPRSPRATGRLAIAQGALVLADEARRYDDLSLALVLAPGRLDLASLSARSGGGTLHATGSATLDGLTPKSLSLAIDARAFQLAVTGALVTRLDGKVRATASPSPDGRAGLAGRIVVDEGRLELPPLAAGSGKLQRLGPLEDVVFVDAAAARDRARAPRALPFPVTAEVRIPGTFSLAGKDVRADVQGELRVVLAGPRATLSGALSATPGGWVDVVGNRFQIDHARIEWGGGDTVDPELDLRLLRRFGDVTVYVDVGGSARKPTVAFSSDPARYTRAELVGLILSGDPQNAIVDERLLDQKVVGALSGAVISTLKSKLLPGLPIDVIKVQLGAEDIVGGVGLATTRLEVGKYITRDVYVSYVHQFGQLPPQTLYHLNANQVTLEWRFARRFEVDTSYGDNGVGGVDLAFRLRF